MAQRDLKKASQLGKVPQLSFGIKINENKL